VRLLPEEVARSIPPLYSAERDPDPLVVVKFFTPDSNWTWWVIEGGADDGDFLFFGLVQGFCRELGYFTLRQLEEVRGPLGLPIERDLWWQPTRLSAV
jgi:hypothetical protein